MTRFVFQNIDFAKGPKAHHALFRHLTGERMGAAVVGLVECKRIDVRNYVDTDVWHVIQNLHDQGRAGCALLVRKTFHPGPIPHELTLGVDNKRTHMLDRWVLSADVGRQVFLFHFPPGRFDGLWPASTAGLARAMADAHGHQLVMSDTNDRFERIPHRRELRRFQLEAHGHGVDGVYTGPRVEVHRTVVDFYGKRHGLTDHPAVITDVVDEPRPGPVKPAPAKPPAEPHSPTKEPAVTAFTDHLAHVLKAEVGYHEGRSSGHWNNVEKYDDQVPGLGWVDNDQVGQAWCAVFAAWGYMKAGLKLGVDFPVTASCDIAGAWYKARSRWSDYPAIGAQVFFGTARDLSHTGIVVAYDADSITTIEGNTNDSGSREGDGVYLKTHRRRETRVIGYGYPLMPEAIVSADPAWRVRKPPTPPPANGTPAPAPKPELAHNHVTEGLADIRQGRALIRRGVGKLRLARGKGNSKRPSVQSMADEYEKREKTLAGVKGPRS